MKLVSVLLISFLVWQQATADDASASENARLLKVDRHLAELDELIEAAEQSVDADARIRFRYDWLRRDIAQVRRGVQVHIHQPLTMKQANAPLQGDYRR